MYRRPGVTKSSLKRNVNRGIVADICADLIKNIDSQIQMTNDMANSSRAVYELPINFIIGDMNRKNAQILIYSELIRVYTTDKEFADEDVYIEFLPNGKANFCVVLPIDMDDEEREERLKIIKTHSRSNDSKKDKRY